MVGPVLSFRDHAMFERRRMPDVVRWPDDRSRTVAFDLEDTVKSNGRVFHFGAVVNGQEDSPISIVINPETDQGTMPTILLDRGVTQDEINAALPFRDHSNNIYALLHGAAVVIMHNAGCDWKNLMREFDRCGHPHPVPRRKLCTLSESRRLNIPAAKGLDSLSRFFNLPEFTAHNATFDAAATYRLYIALINRYPRYFDHLLPMETVKISPYFAIKRAPWTATANLRPPARL